MSKITVSPPQIAAFCQKHGIRRLSFFGSVLREDFRPDSDIDVLVEFEEGCEGGGISFMTIQMELSALLGRQVDLNTPQDLSRYFRQKVLDMAEVLYERTR